MKQFIRIRKTFNCSLHFVTRRVVTVKEGGKIKSVQLSQLQLEFKSVLIHNLNKIIVFITSFA